MKKFYIQPSIEIEIMDASDLLAGSPKIKIEDPTGDIIPVTPTKPEGTNDTGLFGAKGNNLWLSDEDSDW